MDDPGWNTTSTQSTWGLFPGYSNPRCSSPCHADFLFLSSQTNLETSTRTHSPFRCSNSCRSLATWEALENLGLWDAISASVEFPMYKRVTWYSSFITIPDLFAGSKSLDPFQRLERSKVEFASMWIDQYKTGGVLDRLPRLVHNDNTTYTHNKETQRDAGTNQHSQCPIHVSHPPGKKFWRAWSCRCSVLRKELNVKDAQNTRLFRMLNRCVRICQYIYCVLRRPGYSGNKSTLECRRLIFAWAVWVHRTAYLGMRVAGCTNPCPPHLLSIGNLSKDHRQVANVDSQYPSTIPLHSPTILTLCDLIYIYTYIYMPSSWSLSWMFKKNLPTLYLLALLSMHS